MSSIAGAGDSDQEEGRSDVSFSIDLGSSAPTREGDLTVGDTASANYEEGTEENPALVVSQSLQNEEDGVAIALPPTESEEGGEYHEIVLTGSAALDLLDQVSSQLFLSSSYLAS